MVRVLLLEIVKKWAVGDILFLTLVIFTFTFSWMTIISLGLKILKVPIRLKKIIPGAFLLALISLFVKPFIPTGILTLFVILIPCLIIVKLNAKVKWMLSCWVTFLLLLITAIFPLLIISPLMNSNHILALFFTTSRYFIIISSLMEALGIVIVLMFLNIYKTVSLIPSVGKTSVEFTGLFIYFVFLYFSYDSCMRIWENAQNASFLSLARSYITFMLAAGGVVANYLDKVNTQKKLDKTQAEFQEKIKEMDELNKRLKEGKLDPEELEKLSKQIDTLKEALNTPPPPQFDTDPKFDVDMFKIEFTPREQDVLRCIAEGLDNVEIGEKFGGLDKDYIGNLVRIIKAKISARMGIQIADRMLVYYARTWCMINKKNK